MQLLFKQLFAHYFEQLVLYAYRILNDWQAAEDIVQEVFVSLWINKEKINFTIPIKPYLYKVTYNKTMNYIDFFELRKKGAPTSNDEQINLKVMQFNQYDSLLAAELLREINHSMDTLTPKCKEAFLLSRKRHLKNREIAVHMSISEKAVEKHITKALQVIRKQLLNKGLLSGGQG